MAVALMQRAPQPAANEDHQQRYSRLNQRAAIAGCASSPQVMTLTPPPGHPATAAMRCAFSAAARLHFSSPAGGAEQRIGHAWSNPQNRLNGVSQSNMPPLKARPLTVKPLITARPPRRLKVASREPPKRRDPRMAGAMAWRSETQRRRRENQADQHQGQGIDRASMITA